jgi:Fe-S cluster assembly ATPase SufC
LIGTGIKLSFQEAADLAGIPLSGWIRERLRHAAKKDSEEAGRPISFFDNI